MEITKGRDIYTGVKENDKGEIVCEECGGIEFYFIYHADGRDFYMNGYECKCGNLIKIKTNRTGRFTNGNNN